MSDRFAARCRSAIEACRRFAVEHGWDVDQLAMREEMTARGHMFIYTTPDGREFACGAEV